MSDRDIGALGVITAGASFELQQPAHVNIAVLARCTSARDAYLQTVLKFASTGAPDLVVSRTELTSPTPTTAANGAVLRLPAGKYTWSSRFDVNAGGTYSAPNIDTGVAAIYRDIDNLDVMGQCTVHGSRGGFGLISARRERPVYFKARMTAPLTGDQRLRGALRIVELATSGGVVTPLAEIMPPGTHPLETEAAPYYIKANTLYKVSYDLYYDGDAPVSASITISP